MIKKKSAKEIAKIKKKKEIIPESKIQTKIIDYLNSMDIYNFKTIQCNRRGIADIIACVKGNFLAIEVKASNIDCINSKSFTDVQRLEEFKIKNSGGFFMCTNKVKDVSDLVEFILRIQ